MTKNDALVAKLRRILGQASYLRLCDALGGLRVYVPNNLKDDHDLVHAVGREAADKLCAELAPEWIKVPLGRRDLALHYRAQGYSNRLIARRLRVTESAVEKLFTREQGLLPRPAKSSNPAQPRLL